MISNHICVLLKFNRARSVCISSVNQWLVNIDNKLSQFQIGHITNGRNKVLLTRLVAMQLLLIKMFSGECFFMTCLLFKTNLNIIRYTCFFKAAIPSSLLIFMYYTKWDIPGGVNINSTKLIFSNCLLVQIDDFRRLYMYSKDERPTNGCEGRLLDNFRPVKPLHGRVVKASFQWSLK